MLIAFQQNNSSNNAVPDPSFFVKGLARETSSSEGKQLKKRVTFGEPVVVGSPRSGVSGEGDGTEVCR